MYRWLNSSTANRRIIPLKSICHEDKTKGTGTRSHQRKDEKEEKRNDAKNNTTAIRGFSIDQFIEIENLNVRKQGMVDR